jgi:Isochorismatase family
MTNLNVTQATMNISHSKIFNRIYNIECSTHTNRKMGKFKNNYDIGNNNNNNNNNNPIYSLLAPSNCALVMIDFQPQMAFATKSIDGQMLINNAVGLAKSARIFGIPTIFTTIGEKRFAGPMFPQITRVFPDQQMIDRTTMNCWEDDRVVSAFKNTG